MYTDKKTFETIYRNNIDDPYINKRAKYLVCNCSFVVIVIRGVLSQVLSEYDVDEKFIETYRYKRCTVLKKILLSTILLVVLTGCGTHEAEVKTEQPA